MADYDRDLDKLVRNIQALANTLVDHREMIDALQESRDDYGRALIACRNALANDVFPRLDRLEAEAQIDEQPSLPLDVDVTEGRVL